ncbi:kinesin-like protein KIN-14I [Aristolochia californica]|uniref:kinesin-like protein KIN-14I n=1 Tax=Aristolochia californica TaxID=171875 RepID=UPI0035D55545
MASEGFLSFSMASLVEDVVRQHGDRLSDRDLASRKEEQAASRRYEVAGWLRKMVGVVGAKDLPAEPTEEEFRVGLRNGIVLCNALNKVQPSAVPKVVEAPIDSAVPPDGAALSAYQYFENVRNFLVAVEEMGLPTFEASDLNQGGKSARVVNCLLALKSYSDWKLSGCNGSWKYSGNSKTNITGKCFVRKNSEPFTGSLSRNSSVNEKFFDGLPVENNLSGDLSQESSEMNNSRPLNVLVRAVLSDKRPDEVPALVESMLNKVMEEFEHRLMNQNEMEKTTVKGAVAFGDCKSPPKSKAVASKTIAQDTEEFFHMDTINDEESEHRLLKQQLSFEQQQKHIQELRETLHTTKVGMQFMQRKYFEEFTNLGRQIYGLAHAASGYHKVLEENRKLYNQVQDLKGSIRVYCRVRPFLPGQTRMSTVDHIDNGSITILTPLTYGKEVRKTFNFNKVFGPSATQAEVFADTQPLIRSVLDGYNVCIFAYGQTGSGKTHTMTGPRELTEETRGVNFRALSDLFSLSEQRRDSCSYEVSVQMIEIYNEQVRDLLATDGGLNKRLEIRNSSQNGLNVPDAVVVPASTTSDVLELMETGHRNRAVSSTALNDRSSRSHSCLTVHVQGRNVASGTILRGCMHLVDLAGSERVDKSKVTGDRLKEAQHINRSLSALGDVIASLAQKNTHVPYRNSKLTQLLQDSLGGQAKTLMFVHISPEIDAIGETISTLKFAERVATVELGAARVNKDGNEVRELKEQIATLQAALGRKDEAELHSSPVFTPEIPKTKGRGSSRGPSPVHPIRHAGELDQLRNTVSPSDIPKLKGRGPSPIPSNRQGGRDVPSGFGKLRQPMEEVGNIENPPTFRQSKSTTDLQLCELTANNTPTWPEYSLRVECQKGEEKDSGTGEWVDKVMVNRLEVRGHDNLSRSWQVQGASLPEQHLYQGYIPETRIPPELQYGRREGHEDETGITDDSDELEVATSDSSEATDALWQFNVAKLTNIPPGTGSKIKKPQPKPATSSPDNRHPSPAHGSSQSRKLVTAGSKSFNKIAGKPAVSGGIDGKRYLSNGKGGSGK